MAIRLPGNPDAYTNATERLTAQINARWPDVGSLGIYNRRKIAGTNTWSQHAWGNAIDITSPMYLDAYQRKRDGEPNVVLLSPEHYAYLDEIAAWLRRHPEVRVLLWRTTSHWNHIHIDFHPRQYGTPPILGQNNDEEEELKEYLKAVQLSLNKAGFTDADGNSLLVDGILGPKTIYAMGQRDVAAAKQGVNVEFDVDTVRVVKNVRLTNA